MNVKGKAVIVETVLLDDDDDTCCPAPMNLAAKAAVAPFLGKTFDMVDDPATDAVVSWGAALNSFVVWDTHAFAARLLPLHFKHSNFNTFLRQLNTYGFRKVNPDRWEFANAGFLGGQRHLLASIRRSPNVSTLLRHEREALARELARLKQQQEETRAALLDMEHRVVSTERRHEQCKAFLENLTPAFVEGEKKKKKRRRRLNAVPTPPHADHGLAAFEELALAAVTTQSSAGGVTTDMMWYELLGDQEQAEVQVEVDDLVAGVGEDDAEP